MSRDYTVKVKRVKDFLEDTAVPESMELAQIIFVLRQEFSVFDIKSIIKSLTDELAERAVCGKSEIGAQPQLVKYNNEEDKEDV